MSRIRQISANIIASPGLACLLLIAAVTSASAYRPFDGTDAAVAEKGKMEIEMQPAGIFKDASGTTLIAPATRFNYGLTETWEAVLEGQIETPLSPSGPSSVTAAGAFLKIGRASCRERV